MQLHWKILIALILAVIAGLLTSMLSADWQQMALASYGFVGTLFLNALKMLIVPLIFSSIIVGMSSAGKQGAFAKLGLRTVTYYLFTSFIAIMIGLVLVNTIEPGISSEGVAVEVVVDSVALEQKLAKVEGKDASDIAEIFLRMVPPNVIKAAANGQMLGLIFFALLFGYFMMKIQAEKGKLLEDFWQAIFQVMMKITDLVMKFAPIGVFALVAKTVTISGFSTFGSVALFFFTVIAALAIHLFIVMPLLLVFVAKVDPLDHFKAMSPALLTAFSTASSSATLPITMDCIENRAGVSNRTSSFVLPLGATVNMDGTALYECVAAMFIAQVYGLDLTLTVQFSVVVVALLTSIGVAGIPSASLVAISIILVSIGLPMEGIGMLLVVDRVLDMCRTSVNIFSDSCGAVIIAKGLGEKVSYGNKAEL